MVRSGSAIWTIIELEEDVMVLNNVTKFHKILIKSNRLRERMSLDRRMDMRTKVRTSVCTGGQMDRGNT